MSKKDATLRAMGLAPIWKSRPPGTGPVKRQAGYIPSMENAKQHKEVSLTSSAVVSSQTVRKNIGPTSPPAKLEEDGQARTKRIDLLTWPEIAKEVQACRACALGKTRTQAVLGVGDVKANWLFVGEGPGADEDAKGEPFVGQAGKLLDQMLLAIHLRRGEDVYIANTVKCRPPANRTPTSEEMATCLPYLARQIALIKPRIIVALGRPAAMTLLAREIKISEVRGHTFDYQGVPLVITYHPAYLLRNPPEKIKAWEDLCYLRKVFSLQEKKMS